MLYFNAKIGDFTFRYFKGFQWLLIFHHNITGPVHFANEDEALNCHEFQKYSILSSISDDMKINGKFEFMLQYGSSKTKFNWWLQDKNPLHESEEGKDKADGFIAKQLDYNVKNFGGLAKTSLKYQGCINCLLNGLFDDSLWYYGIGQYKSCYEDWQDSIPVDEFGKGEQIVDLWLRVSPTFLNIYVTICKKKTYFQISIQIFILIIL